ncbi:MAG: hypothetical protein AAB308_07345, partial [Nitrospirota bacterium]
PELACCTASIERVRIVLMQVWSSCAFVTMAPLFWRCVPGALPSMVLFKYVGRFKRKLERWCEGDGTELHTKGAAE